MDDTFTNWINGLRFTIYSNHATLYECRAVGEIQIPRMIYGVPVTGIGSAAFCGNGDVTSVDIPSSVRIIYQNAFRNCFGLKKVAIPQSVEYIGSFAFCGTKLKKDIFVKATDAAMCCRRKQYEMNTWFEEPKADLCRCGFHYCENAFDIFRYYDGYCGEIGTARFFEVEVDGVSSQKSEDSKRVCKRIKFVREFKSYAELLN